MKTEIWTRSMRGDQMDECVSWTYLSFLLRLWREKQSDEFVWRASLDSVQTGERIHFVDVEELFAYLSHRTGLNPTPQYKK